jgi:hypothetical protein
MLVSIQKNSIPTTLNWTNQPPCRSGANKIHTPSNLYLSSWLRI